MKSHVQLGNALGLAATPAFVINGVAILGHPGRKSLAGIITSVRACGKVVC
jgi:protein-disulfide isomerase